MTLPFPKHSWALLRVLYACLGGESALSRWYWFSCTQFIFIPDFLGGKVTFGTCRFSSASRDRRIDVTCWNTGRRRTGASLAVTLPAAGCNSYIVMFCTLYSAKRVEERNTIFSDYNRENAAPYMYIINTHPPYVLPSPPLIPFPHDICFPDPPPLGSYPLRQI